MRMSNSSVAIAVFFGCALVAGPSAAQDALRVGGTGSAIGMLRQVGAEFTAATGVEVEVVTSLGSNGAIRPGGRHARHRGPRPAAENG